MSGCGLEMSQSWWEWVESGSELKMSGSGWEWMGVGRSG